jgi:hypothetical protein
VLRSTTGCDRLAVSVLRALGSGQSPESPPIIEACGSEIEVVTAPFDRVPKRALHHRGGSALLSYSRFVPDAPYGAGRLRIRSVAAPVP